MSVQTKVKLLSTGLLIFIDECKEIFYALILLLSRIYLIFFSRAEKNLNKRVRATLESSSKRGSSDRISNRQEFWSIEMGHVIYNNGNRALEVLRERKYF